jgi:hypothetical protein
METETAVVDSHSSSHAEEVNRLEKRLGNLEVCRGCAEASAFIIRTISKDSSSTLGSDCMRGNGAKACGLILKEKEMCFNSY